MFDLYWICSDDTDYRRVFVHSFNDRADAEDYARANCGPWRGYDIAETDGIPLDDWRDNGNH